MQDTQVKARGIYIQDPNKERISIPFPPVDVHFLYWACKGCMVPWRNHLLTPRKSRKQQRELGQAPGMKNIKHIPFLGPVCSNTNALSGNKDKNVSQISVPSWHSKGVFLSYWNFKSSKTKIHAKLIFLQCCDLSGIFFTFAPLGFYSERPLVMGLLRSLVLALSEAHSLQILAVTIFFCSEHTPPTISFHGPH